MEMFLIYDRTDGPVQKHSAICFLQTMAVCEKRDLSECAGDWLKCSISGIPGTGRLGIAGWN